MKELTQNETEQVLGGLGSWGGVGTALDVAGRGITAVTIVLGVYQAIDLWMDWAPENYYVKYNISSNF